MSKLRARRYRMVILHLTANRPTGRKGNEMSQYVVDLRDGIAQKLALDNTLDSSMRFIVVEAENAEDAFARAGYKPAIKEWGGHA